MGGGVYELLLSVENGGTVLFEGWSPLFVEGDGFSFEGFNEGVNGKSPI